MKSIAFDLDGTLIDISQRDYKIYVDILLECNCYTYLKFDEYWNYRRDHKNIFEILAKSKFDEDYWSYFIEKRKAKMETMEYLFLDVPFNNIHNNLKILSKAYNLILVTKRSYNANCFKQLKLLKLSHFFKDIHITTLDKSEIFKSINNLSYVIGDTENDIIPGSVYSDKTIAILTGIRSEASLAKFKPSLILNNIDELMLYIKQTQVI